MPSGCMANIAAMMTVCPTRGDACVVGNWSHIVNYERGGLSTVGGIMPWVIANEEDGTMPLDQIEKVCNFSINEHIVPVTGISLESPHNNKSGVVLRPDYIKKVKKIAKKRKAKLHLDGARSWNASLFLGLEMKEMCQDFDIISICMSKGMGCPIGSLIVGTEKDMITARNHRKILGGAMRQTGIFAACGLVSLHDWQEKLTQDNLNAKWIAEELYDIKGVNVEPEKVETNILRFTFDPEVMKKNIRTDYFGFVGRLKEEENILVNPGFANDYIRLVTHRDVSREMCEKFIQTVKRMVNP